MNVKHFIIILHLLCLSAFSQNEDYFLEGMAYLSKNDFQKAEKSFNTAIGLKQNETKSTFYLGIAQYNLQKYPLAIESFTLSKDKGVPNSFYWLAKAHAASKNAELSVFYLKKHFETDKTIFPDKALKDVSFKAIHLSEEWQNFTVNLSLPPEQEAMNEAAFQIKNGNFKKAHLVLDELLTEYKDETIHALKAKAYEAENLYEPSIYELKKALEFSPENVQYLTNIADNYSRVKKYDKAIENYQLALSLAPESFDIYPKLAEACLRNKKTTLAKKYLQTYLKYFNEDQDAVLLTSTIYFELKEYKTALSYINPLFKTTRYPKAEWFLTRGKIYFQTGSYKYSAEDLSMLLDLVPNSKEGNLLLGSVQHKLGNTKSACFYWKRAQRFGALEAIEMLQKYCE